VRAVKRESLAFLVAGLAFGILFGYGLFHAIAHRPDASVAATGQESAPSPAGPMAPTQGGGQSAAAPMLEEVNALKRELQADPNNLEALTRLANLLHDAQMWSQAATLYERAVRLSPNNANLLTDLGICYQNLKQYDKALEQFARAQKVSPDHWQSLYNTVVVAGFDLGRLDDAATALKRLEDLNPAAPNLPELKEALAKARLERASPGRS
jgi:tetratricopeptide (TPR) repeat protein